MPDERGLITREIEPILRSIDVERSHQAIWKYTNQLYDILRPAGSTADAGSGSTRPLSESTADYLGNTLQ